MFFLVLLFDLEVFWVYHCLYSFFCQPLQHFVCRFRTRKGSIGIRRFVVGCAWQCRVEGESFGEARPSRFVHGKFYKEIMLFVEIVVALKCAEVPNITKKQI